AADVLCSDYYPAGLLAAVFALIGEGILDPPSALALATASAGGAAGLDGRAGAIRPGWPADLLLVSTAAGYPAVAGTAAGGQVALGAAPGRRPQPGEPAPPPLYVAARPC